MHISLRSAHLVKAGNAGDEYEDALWPACDVDRRASGFRCAVADGASESSFSGEWARLLARSWSCGGGSTRRWLGELPRLSRRWETGIPAGDLPWYVQAKIDQGAFAALVGLHIVDSRRWSAIAVGDSCLFQVRSGRRIASFPYTAPEHFGNRPLLIPSRGRVPEVLRTAGAWRPGDTFYLMSDALAQWSMCEDDRSWRLLDRALDGRAPFADLVRRLRRRGHLRNDDVTVLRLTVH